jgi:hypothetical protein
VAYSTVYDVRVRYSVDNKAGRSGTQGLANDVRRLDQEVKRTSGSFARLGGIVVGAFGARAAGSALLSFNANVQDTKGQIAAMLALVKKTDLVDQLKAADRIYSNLQKRAATLPGTTEEYVTMAGKLTRVIVSAGGTTKDLEDLTVKAVVAAKGLGEAWDVAARDIEQALMGRYNTTDPFLSKILPMIGYSGEEGRDKWRGLSADKRFEEMKRALTQKQITQAAALQGQNFSGLVSQTKDALQQFAGKVGVPLFKAVTAELKSWNEWISKNGNRINDMATAVGTKIADGFRVVKDVVGFLVDHADVLIAAGKVWAAVKIGGMLAGGVGNAASGGGGLLSGLRAWLKAPTKAKDSIDPFTGEYSYTPSTPGGRGRQSVGGLGGILENAGKLGSSFGVGYAIGNMLGLDKVGESLGGRLALLTGRTDATTLAFEKIERQSKALEDSLRRAAEANPKGPRALTNLKGQAGDYRQQANLVRDVVAAYKAVSANPADISAMRKFAEKREAAEAAGLSMADIMRAGGADSFIADMRAKASGLDSRASGAGLGTFAAMTAGVRLLTEYQRKTLETELAQEEISRYMVQQLAAGKLINPETVMEILRRNTADPDGKHKNVADKPKVNVTIQRIEVQSDDPDRMAFGLIESFRDAAKNPSSALASFREG